MSEFAPNSSFTGYDEVKVNGYVDMSQSEFDAIPSLYAIEVTVRTKDVLHILRTQPPAIATEPFSWDDLPELITIYVSRAGGEWIDGDE